MLSHHYICAPLRLCDISERAREAHTPCGVPTEKRENIVPPALQQPSDVHLILSLSLHGETRRNARLVDGGKSQLKVKRINTKVDQSIHYRGDFKALHVEIFQQTLRNVDIKALRNLL